MSDEKNRILSYKLASILEPENLEHVAGGATSLKTMRTQRIRNTQANRAACSSKSNKFYS